MSNLYTINVTNHSNSNQEFFFFQKPAVYTGGSQVYSNSLYHAVLLPFAKSGAVLTFEMDVQYYAGVQQQTAPPAVGHVAGDITASQPVDLTVPGNASTMNTTAMMVAPSLGLAPATHTDSVQPGAFRIIAPTYNPNTTGNFNIGTAIQSGSGTPAVVSNFIVAQPSQFVDCQPVLTFYVQTGSYKAGQVINFTSASTLAAMCDTTNGTETFNVTYNVDGTWSVA